MVYDRFVVDRGKIQTIVNKLNNLIAYHISQGCTSISVDVQRIFGIIEVTIYGSEEYYERFLCLQNAYEKSEDKMRMQIKNRLGVDI